MSKWEQILSERRQHLQEYTKVGVLVMGELLSFCEDIDFTPRTDRVEDLAAELETLLNSGILSETQSDRLGGILETFKKMIFKMLDKTKKTIVAKDAKDDTLVGEASTGAPTPTEDRSALGRPRMAWQKRKREKKADGEGRMESIRGLLEMGQLISLTGPTAKSDPGSDAAKFCDALNKALGPMVKSQFFVCHVNTRFAAYGGLSVEVKYAAIPASASRLDQLNAKVQMHASIDGFDKSGNVKGPKIKLEILTRRGMKVRGKSGTPSQVIKHIVTAIQRANA